MSFFSRIFGKEQSKESVDSIDNMGSLPSIEKPITQLCTYNQFKTDVYNDWCAQFKENPRYHRKQWEFVYILQVLKNFKLLKSGKKGIGFGVGVEPLPALFASYGCEVLATDLAMEQAKGLGWISTNQHSHELSQLNERRICDNETFNSLVSFTPADMNRISKDLRNSQFDFTWSACSLEHLGSLNKGLDFIINSLDTLKPGGIAVHTTEYNIGSDDKTLESGGTVLYRRRDIESLVHQVRSLGHHIEFNPNPGEHILDKYYDIPPYRQDFHLRLLIEPYVTTSVGIVIQKK